MKKIITQRNGYISEKEDNYSYLAEMAFEQYAAYLYLEQSDRKKYGTILSVFNTQYSLGNDQYPKSMAEVIIVLSNHKFDHGYNQSNNQSNHNRSNTSAMNINRYPVCLSPS